MGTIVTKQTKVKKDLEFLLDSLQREVSVLKNDNLRFQMEAKNASDMERIVFKEN